MNKANIGDSHKSPAVNMPGEIPADPVLGGTPAPVDPAPVGDGTTGMRFGRW
jgi:hypothetical protein